MTEEVDVERLGERLEAMGGPQRARRAGLRPSAGKVLGAFGVLGILGIAAYALNQAEVGEEPLATAQPDDWQGFGEGFEAMTPPLGAQAAAVPASAPTAAAPAEDAVSAGPSETELALLQRLADMEAQLQAMSEGTATGANGSADEIARLGEQLEALSDETDDLRQEARDADQLARERGSEVRRLEAALLASQADLEAARYLPSGEASIVEAQATAATSDKDAQRLAALEERRAEAETTRQARIDSPLIAFGGAAAPGEPGPAAAAPDLGQDEAFLRAGARASGVEQATVVADPSRTVIQGTLIQAAMETAIDSSLPGAIRAVVSEDVHSFDGSRVLIPRGSKLIGRYNSQIEPTQRRLMVAWDRIVTPDGQSVAISAYGADELGRSGTTGAIDRRLGTRFGSAALVSLISALPSAAAASVDDPLASELVEELGGDAEDAAGSALEPYLSVAPTITVHQGARITVLVDRDLELL